MAAPRLSPLLAARRAAGYTQESLAEVLGTDRSTIGRWERGVQHPHAWQRGPLADALHITLADLDEILRPAQAGSSAAETSAVPAPDHPRSPDNSVSDVDVITAAIPRLRRALDGLDLPDDGPTRDLAELRADVARASDDRLQSRYVALARRLPWLITEIARAAQLGDRAARQRAAGFLTLVLRAADGIAFKFGYLDLSARLIDLMRTTAQLADDPLLLTAVAYVRTETFFATGDLDTAARALDRAIDQVPVTDDPATTAAMGALHMRAAVVAGRAGRGDDAGLHLREADVAARDVPEGVYQGTAFGPSSLRIHELAVAVELRDPSAVIRAASWTPPRELPAERRSHYYIDLARAQLDLGQHDAAYGCLQNARRAAPEHTRGHPQVRSALSTLLRTHRAPDSGLLDLAAWAQAR